MDMKKLSLLILVVLAITTANAQLGALKNIKGSGSSKTSGGKSKENKLPALVYNARMPVSLDYKYVVFDDIELTEDGYLRHGYIKVTFPPTEDANGPIDYNSKYRVFLQLTKDGNEVYKKPCKEENSSTLYKIFIPDPNNDATRAANNRVTEGKYRFNYFLDDSIFYAIDFEVKSITTDDPYAKVAKKYMIDGPWNKLAYITIASDNRFEFNTFIRHESIDPLKQCIYWMELYKDGKVVAASDEPGKKGASSVGNITCKWKKQNYVMQTLVNGKLTANYASTTTLTDGDYTLKASYDGKEFKYSFSIKDGKIVPVGNQVFSPENSTQYIEGMGKNFFFVKE